MLLCRIAGYHFRAISGNKAQSKERYFPGAYLMDHNWAPEAALQATVA